MGRLFWKMFVLFWLSLVLASAAVGVAVWLYKQVDGEDESGRQRGGFALRTVGTVLRHGGADAARDMLEEWHARQPRTQVFVIGADGRELLGRSVPHDPQDGGTYRSESARGPDGRTYQLLAVAPPRPHGQRRGRERPPPWLPLAGGLLASLGFSGLMAWSLSRPVRRLRSALGFLAEGHLDTRVGTRMGSWRDEIVDLGRDFDHMAQRLQALVGAQRRLLHDVSHELRSPLARLQAAIGLARQSPQRGEELMARVERESVRLDRLVGELLTLARLDAEPDEARGEALDLLDLAAAVASDAAFEAEVGGRTLSFEGSGEALILGDGAQLQRAFENVMRNAVKFSPGGGHVGVSAEVHDNVFCMQVSDQGPGVASEALETIFEPFHRSGDGAADGFGLGLAIARRAVHAHGGTIHARNREQGGLEMRIELPLGEVS